MVELPIVIVFVMVFIPFIAGVVLGSRLQELKDEE